MTTLIVIDHENPGHEFWVALCSRHPGDPALGEIRTKLLALGPGEFVLAPTDIAEAFVEWCATLPGWSGGPRHAPHPLFFSPDE